MSHDIPLDLIDSDLSNPRKHFDETGITELARSMEETGLAVPILLRPIGERFVIVHGERRCRAARSLGWETIPAEVRDVSLDEARWLALVENVQRSDLSPIEEAEAYRERLDSGITQAELGGRIGKSQSYVATKLRFLTLPEVIQRGLADGRITEGHAKQLLRVSDTEYQTKLYQRAVSLELSVRALREEVAQAVKILEARQRAAELQEYASDEDLLLACGCEACQTDYWPAKDFRQCANRFEGIFARFMYLFSAQGGPVTQGDPVCAYNFTSPEAMMGFDFACAGMHRDKTEDVPKAGLVFVHFPARCSELVMRKMVAEIRSKVRSDATVVCRVGTERVELPEISATLDRFSLVMSLKRNGFFVREAVVCTLVELPPPERDSDFEQDSGFEQDYGELIQAALNTKGLISVYEDWQIASMSRDIRWYNQSE